MPSRRDRARMLGIPVEQLPPGRYRYISMAPGETDLVPYNGLDPSYVRHRVRTGLRAHCKRQPHKNFRVERTDAGVLVERIA